LAISNGAIRDPPSATAKEIPRFTRDDK